MTEEEWAAVLVLVVGSVRLCSLPALAVAAWIFSSKTGRPQSAFLDLAGGASVV